MTTNKLNWKSRTARWRGLLSRRIIYYRSSSVKYCKIKIGQLAPSFINGGRVIGRKRVHNIKFSNSYVKFEDLLIALKFLINYYFPPPNRPAPCQYFQDKAAYSSTPSAAGCSLWDPKCRVSTVRLQCRVSTVGPPMLQGVHCGTPSAGFPLWDPQWQIFNYFLSIVFAAFVSVGEPIRVYLHNMVSNPSTDFLKPNHFRVKYFLVIYMGRGWQVEPCLFFLLIQCI